MVGDLQKIGSQILRQQGPLRRRFDVTREQESPPAGLGAQNQGAVVARTPGVPRGMQHAQAPATERQFVAGSEEAERSGPHEGLAAVGVGHRPAHGDLADRDQPREIHQPAAVVAILVGGHDGFQPGDPESGQHRQQHPAAEVPTAQGTAAVDEESPGAVAQQNPVALADIQEGDLERRVALGNLSPGEENHQGQAEGR